MVGVAVKVTLVPEHIVVTLAPILTLAGMSGLTVIVIPFDVAGESIKHGEAFEVIITITSSESTNDVVVYVAVV